MVAACREGQKRLVVARQPTGGLRAGPLIMWDKNYLSIIRKIFFIYILWLPKFSLHTYNQYSTY